MDIIDKLINQIDKEQAPRDLKRQVLDIPKQRKSWFRFRMPQFNLTPKRFALNIVTPLLVLAMLSFGIYYQYFRIPNVLAAFELTAENYDAAGITPNTSFILKSNHKLSAYQISKVVTFDPEIDFDVDGLDDNNFRITPKGDLSPDTVYSITIAEGVADHNYSWAYQVKAPFQVIGSIPGDKSVSVPTNTGIEINFNRESFLAPEEFFQINPPVKGKFEQYGSTLTFVPDKALTASTVYQVTIKKGLTINNSLDKLENDYTFSFETEGPLTASQYLNFTYDFGQFVPGQPSFEVYHYNVTSADTKIKLYKYPDASSFTTAYSDSRNWQYFWSTYNSSARKQDFGKLSKIAEFNPQFTQMNYGQHMQVPTDLSVGYYVVEAELNGKQSYMWFQITPLAHYASFTGDNSLVWLYDFVKKQPVVNASVAAATTDGNGLATFSTPQEFKNSNDDMLQYRMNASGPNLLKIDHKDYEPYFIQQTPDYYYSAIRAANPYWNYLSTDRPLYQPTDSLKFWGFLKNRDDSSVPEHLNVGIYHNQWNREFGYPYTNNQKPLMSADVQPTKLGSFEGSLNFSGLTPGYYTLIAKIGDRVISSSFFSTFTYSKPAYTISIEPESKAYYTGQDITYRVSAKFYDGTPVSNLRLNYQGYWNNPVTGSTTTDTDGNATIKLKLSYYAIDNYEFWPKTFDLTVRAATAEYGEIKGAANVLVFGPRLSLNFNSKVNGDGSNTFTGEVRKIDPSKDSPPTDRGYNSNLFDGGPASGQNVNVVIKKITYTQNETGSYYDPINKVSMPTFTYDRNELIIESFQTKTGADGKFEFNKKYAVENSSYYEVTAETSDSSGIKISRTNYYSSHIFTPGSYSPTYTQGLVSPRITFSDDTSYKDFSVNEQVPMKLKLMNASEKTVSSKILYYSYQRKILKTSITESTEFSDTFSEGYRPSLNYRAVVLGPRGFEQTEDVTAYLAPDDARIKIEITTDKEKYRPGEEVKVKIVSRDNNNNPIQSEINLAVVDEALFNSTQYYSITDILSELYASVTTYPAVSLTRYDRFRSDGGRGGGNDDSLNARRNFVDTAHHQTIVTGRDGKAETSFKLPDNLTSWRITAKSFNFEQIKAGQKTKNISTSLPFFADVTVADNYLTGDKPNVRVRLFGSDYKAGQSATISLMSSTLNLDTQKTLDQQTVSLELPSLISGTHTLTIKASQGNNSDILERKIKVTNSYFTKPEISTYEVQDDLSGIKGNDNGLTHLIFTDAGSGKYYSTLSWFAYLNGSRLDQRAVSYFAQKTLAEKFGSEQSPDKIDMSAFIKDSKGLSLITYGDADLKASAFAANLITEQLPKENLISYFYASLYDKKADIHRTVLALYGLSAFKQPILNKLQTIKNDYNLNLEDRMLIASALANLGDKENARKIFNDQIRIHFKYESNQAYIEDADATRQVKLTSLAAVVAAQTESKDELSKLWQYATTHYATKDTTYMELSLVAKHALVSRYEPITLTYETDNGEETIKLKAGEQHALELLPQQLKTLKIKDVSREQVALISRYDIYTDPAELTKNTSLRIGRNYSVDGRETTSFTEGQTVKVTLTLDGQISNTNNVFQVTDFLPSGLKPITPTYHYNATGISSCDYWYPDLIEGNRVSFTVYNNSFYSTYCKQPGQRIVYYARVVTTGSYKADPAIISPADDPANLNITNQTQITIK